MTTDIERGGMDVSGPHEPSYYEIALTNRQVVVAFVILLVCVVAAFLSGVWIGRESAARAQEKLALLSRAAGAPGDAAAGDKEKPEGQALQEFKFFADSHRRQDKEKSARSRAAAPETSAPETASPRDAAPAQAGAPASSSASPAAAAAAPTAAGRAARRAAAAAVRPEPGEAAGEGEATRSAPGARSTPGSGSGSASTSRSTRGSGLRVVSVSPRGEPTASGIGATSRSTSGSGAAAAGEVVIQVFSSADRDQADKVRDRLVSAGLTAFLSPIAKNGQTMYRVRIGPFPSRPAAETVAEKVRKEHKLDTWITPK